EDLSQRWMSRSSGYFSMHSSVYEMNPRTTSRMSNSLLGHWHSIMSACFLSSAAASLEIWRPSSMVMRMGFDLQVHGEEPEQAGILFFAPQFTASHLHEFKRIGHTEIGA